MKSGTLVSFDDWQALYGPDGERLTETHRIPVRDLVQLLDLPLDLKAASLEFDAVCSEQGEVPERLSDFPKGTLQ